MAHQTDQTQVHIEFPAENIRVKDPVCGKEMSKREARSVLLRDGEPVYFCSKACREKHSAPQKTSDYTSHRGAA